MTVLQIEALIRKRGLVLAHLKAVENRLDLTAPGKSRQLHEERDFAESVLWELDERLRPALN